MTCPAYTSINVHANREGPVELALEAREHGDFVTLDVKIMSESVTHTTSIFLDPEVLAQITVAVTAFNQALAAATAAATDSL
jgi:hypothetical protein